MKFPREAPRSRSDDHLIPLINVVFLMLIFFMVVGRITPSDPHQVRPPTSRSEQLPERHSIRLRIARDGSLRVNDTPATPESLLPSLQTALDEISSQGEEAAEIHILADAALTAGQLRRLLASLHDGGWSKVRLLTWREQQ